MTGAAAAGVLLIGFVFFTGASAAPYTCSSLLTPGPVESVTPRPSLLATPTPVATASAAATASADASSTPQASAGASPAASGSAEPSAGQSPAGSPAASPAPSAAPSPTAQPTPEPEPTARLGFTTSILGNQHVPVSQTINYGFCPPTSGDHIADPPRGPIPAAVYPATEEKAPGGWVHNLEHGWVALLYRCEDNVCPTSEEMAQMTQWFDQAPVIGGCPKQAIVARFDSMETRFALVAWGRALLIDEFDLDTALTFAQQWMDHEDVPERATC